MAEKKKVEMKSFKGWVAVSSNGTPMLDNMVWNTRAEAEGDVDFFVEAVRVARVLVTEVPRAK